jgi:CheY-like chemotaxis protein
VLVDDNLEFSDMRPPCSRPDYEIAARRNGEEGLTAALGLQPDVVVLDVLMPSRIPGSEAAATTQTPAAIIMTFHEDVDYWRPRVGGRAGL